MRLLLIQPETPVAEPLSLIEAGHQLRLISSDEEAESIPDKVLVNGFIAAAREMAENYTNRAIKQATYELICDDLGAVTLPKPPFQELVSITYTDTEGVKTVLPEANYQLLEGAEPMFLSFTQPENYKRTPNGVRIRFKAGYESVPFALKAAMQLLVGHLYENREAVVIGSASFANALPLGAEHLMNPYRIYSF